MEKIFSKYESRCEQEMAAADSALSEDDRVAHLEQALRYAQLAAKARPQGELVDLMRWRREHAAGR
jgi:hypothetical protein